MLSVALANLRFVEKKQEIQDEKLDELECQLARLENRLESRFKLPDVAPSTLDTKYMTLDEMDLEAGRLHDLISNARDIRDKESILKGLRDAQDKLRSWREAKEPEINTFPKYSRRERLMEGYRRFMELKKEYCRNQLGTAIFLARLEFSSWEMDRQHEEWDKKLEEREREKDSPEEPPKN